MVSTGAVLAVSQEGWHAVGGTGEPAFGVGFSNFAGDAPVGFRKDPSGEVSLRGLANAPAVASGQFKVAFQLPPGYRPTANERFVVPGGNGSVMVRVIPDGSIQVFNATGFTSTVAAGWIDLSSINFSNEQTTFPTGKSVIPVVTALPTGPTEGDEVYLSTGTRRWHLRYEGGATPRWYYLGSAPLISGPTGALSFNSTVPTAPSTGPSLTVPFKGRYLLGLGAYLEGPIGGAQILQAQVYKTPSGGAAAGIAAAFVTVKGCGARCASESEQDFLAGDFLDFRVYGNTASVAYSGDNFKLSLLPIYLT